MSKKKMYQKNKVEDVNEGHKLQTKTKIYLKLNSFKDLEIDPIQAFRLLKEKLDLRIQFTEFFNLKDKGSMYFGDIKIFVETGHHETGDDGDLEKIVIVNETEESQYRDDEDEDED